MAIRPILQNGDPILREVALPVPEELFGTPELDQIITDMADTLDEQLDGVAIAAPQIGISYRIFLVRYDRTLPPTPENASPVEAPATPSPEVGVFINPKFVRSSRRRDEVDEGCLSVRGNYGTTLRHERATVQARRADGSRFERGGGGLLAQIFQHETDHLDGILFIDHAINLTGSDISKATGSEFVFFGTPYVARDTLEILKARGYIPKLIVTSPTGRADAASCSLLPKRRLLQLKIIFHSSLPKKSLVKSWQRFRNTKHRTRSSLHTERFFHNLSSIRSRSEFSIFTILCFLNIAGLRQLKLLC